MIVQPLNSIILCLLCLGSVYLIKLLFLNSIKKCSEYTIQKTKVGNVWNGTDDVCKHGSQSDSWEEFSSNDLHISTIAIGVQSHQTINTLTFSLFSFNRCT